MVKSMTGFGRAFSSYDGREITVELKGVNHRYLDFNFHMPRHIGFIEETLKDAISARLARGHLDIFVNYRNTRRDARTVMVDKVLLAQYLEVARGAAEELLLTDDITLSAALRLPDVTDIMEAEEDCDAVSALARDAAEKALDGLEVMRVAEGKKLHDDLFVRIGTTRDIADRIAERAPLVVAEYRERLNARIQSVLDLADVDTARLATEVALFADRASIDEELVRLHSHMEQFLAMIGGAEPAGRKLDFIVQEINREFNTIGSKANDKTITQLVIEGKAEVEKLREQIQNIE